VLAPSRGEPAAHDVGDIPRRGQALAWPSQVQQGADQFLAAVLAVTGRVGAHQQPVAPGSAWIRTP